MQFGFCVFVIVSAHQFMPAAPANLALSQIWISIKELLRVAMLTPGSRDEFRNVIRKPARPSFSVLIHQRSKEIRRDGETRGMFCFICGEIVGPLFNYGVWRSVGEMAI